MSHRILKTILALLIILVSFYSLPSLAQQQSLPGNANGSIGTGNATGACDWNAYLNVLADQESLKKCGPNPTDNCKSIQYKTVRDASNPFSGGRDASWGRFQFVPGTWSSIVQPDFPQCVRYGGISDLPGGIGATKYKPNLPHAISQTCWEAQDYAAKKFTKENLEFLKGKNWCDMLGSTVTGTHIGPGNKAKTCIVTKSGLLSATHNAGKTCSRLKGSGKTGSHLRARMCDAKGIAFPEDCNPQKPSISSTIKEPTGSTPAPQHYLPNSHFYSLSEILKYNVVAAFQQMTAQMTTLMMQQVQIIGTFFDAKHQLETQRLLQQKAAQAHKDYHPSVQMCEIGTFMRNLINTERRADVTQAALTQSMMDRALATGDAKTSRPGYDQNTKKRALIDTFCNPADNGKQNSLLCDETYDPEQINADINFTRTIDAPLTLDVDVLDNDVQPDEENLFAFLDYIFMHDRFPFIGKSNTIMFNFIGPYQDMRSVIAMRSVAQNSFAEIIAQKTAGPDDTGRANNEKESVGPFMKALMREMGIGDDEIEATIGKNPSYYAQMEILTKTIYQHPDFIANLYDKPANVKRIRAALTAIKLMQDRDIHDAMMRREMLMSVLLELQLRKKQRALENGPLKEVIYGPPGTPRDLSPNAGTRNSPNNGTTF